MPAAGRHLSIKEVTKASRSNSSASAKSCNALEPFDPEAHGPKRIMGQGDIMARSFEKVQRVQSELLSQEEIENAAQAKLGQGELHPR